MHGSGLLGGGLTSFQVSFNANLAGVLLCWKARVDLPMSPYSSPACFRFTAGGTPTRTPSPTPTPTVAGLDDRGAMTGKYSAPRADDRTFVVDSAAALDTECRYAADGPITFSIPVTRYVGEVNGAGQLLDPNGLVAEGVIRHAWLNISAWDVDAGGEQHPDKVPEDDRVYFNDVFVGSLEGANRAWSVSTFGIEVDQIKFPPRGSGGNAPVPALNTVRIEPDKGNSASQRVWCTAVDWALLGMKVISPIVLIHGNGSNGPFFNRQGFATYLTNHKIPFNNSISMETASIANHADQLSTLLPPIVRSFGVDSIHLVAHSKGGLDSRAYLTNYHVPRSANGPFDVLSLTTLSTPHKGSSLADYVIAQSRRATFDNNAFATLGPLLSRITSRCEQGADAGRQDLTTDVLTRFNLLNLPRLPRTTEYFAMSGDADVNSNGRIDYIEDSVSALVAEDSSCLGFIAGVNTDLAASVVDIAYQFLRHTAAVRVKNRLVGASGRYAFEKVAVLVDGGDLNDTLVTIDSAESETPPFEPIMSFVGLSGRNHSTIADQGVASVARPFWEDTDRSVGDLR